MRRTTRREWHIAFGRSVTVLHNAMLEKDTNFDGSALLKSPLRSSLPSRSYNATTRV